MKLTFQSYSFGCRVNQAEREELDRQLINQGYNYVENDPDILIINSCSVTNKAEREARQLIYQIKRKDPKTKIIVTGCAATNWAKLKQKIPEIDLLIDNQNKEYLATIIKARFGLSAVIPAKAGIQGSWIPDQDLRIGGQVRDDKYFNSRRIILKIQDGCHRFCTYCIVPYLRGLPKTIPITNILNQINKLNNIQEVILTAINTEAYGYDNKENLIDLIKNIIENTTVPRISFGSIHPWSITPTFLKSYKQLSKLNRVINFFHIPLQSGSNKILTFMKRGYSREEFEFKINGLASIKPYTFIATDVIVGFLEETEQDFEDTYNLLDKLPISKFHIFRFSQRAHTAAFYLSKSLKEPSHKMKLNRAKLLADLSQKKYEVFLKTHIGHTFRTLILEKQIENFNEGLLSNQIPVLVNSNKSTIGTLKNVKIVEYKKGRLFGKIE